MKFYCYCCACFERGERIIKDVESILPVLPDANVLAKLKLARKWMQTGAVHATLRGHDEECPNMKRAMERQTRTLQQVIAANSHSTDDSAGHA